MNMKINKIICAITILINLYYSLETTHITTSSFLSPLCFILSNPFFVHCTQTLEQKKIIYRLGDHYTHDTSFHGKVYTHTKNIGTKEDVTTALLYRPHVHSYFYGAIGIIVEGDHINHALFFTLTAGDFIALQKGKTPEDLYFALNSNSLLGKLTSTEHNIFGMTINSIVIIHVALILPGDSKSTYELLKSNGAQAVKNLLSSHIPVSFCCQDFMVSPTKNITLGAFFGNNCGFREITKDAFVE